MHPTGMNYSLGHMDRTALLFDGKLGIEVAPEPMPSPKQGEVLIRTLYSAISAGTEMLLYRGQMPKGMDLDLTIEAFKDPVRYPQKYGYASVAEVIKVGKGVDKIWEGRYVFAFQPHQSHSIISLEGIIPIPNNIDLEDAVLLASVETGLSLMMDGNPIIGEKVAVIGQGVIGLLLTGLLSLTPLSRLITFERHELRRKMSVMMGSQACFDPDAQLEVLASDSGMGEGADLTFEISGNPEALSAALMITGYDGRVIVGSWYGDKKVSLDLGTRFHRNRNRLIGSQVSRIDPRLTGRWTKARRIGIAWEMMRRLKPSRLITHRLDIHDAPKAYELLDKHPEQACQVILRYEGG
jgi:2-desacetyl-2-hydroxyethyl bacteriochlorophyllide A dehydrogenase